MTRVCSTRITISRTMSMSRNGGMDPALHYATLGWKQGRRPNPTFDPNYYRDATAT